MDGPGSLRSWAEDGVLCGVLLGSVIAVPAGLGEQPALGLLALAGGAIGGAAAGVLLRVVLLRWPRVALWMAVPLGALVAAWTNVGLAQIPTCSADCPVPPWTVPAVGRVIGVVVGLGWLAYAPVRYRGRGGSAILLVGFLAGLVGLVPIPLMFYKRHCHYVPSVPPVTVAMHDLAVGKTIDVDDIALEERVPEVVYPPSILQGPDAAVGRVPVERILAGEPIREERLAAPEAGVGLRAVSPHGYRRVEVDAALDGLVVEPGQHVDVVRLAGEGAVRAALVLQVREGGGLVLAVPPGEAERLEGAGLVKVILVGDAPASRSGGL